MKRYPENALASLVLLASTYSACAQSSSEVLAELAENLSTVRSASGAEPVGAEPIDVEGLLGVSRNSIASALGIPDNCEEVDAEACSSKRQWHFLFFYLPPDMLGGGPELWLNFDSEDNVEESEWHLSR